MSIEHVKKCQEVCVQEIYGLLPDAKIHAEEVVRSPHIVSVDVGMVEAQVLVVMIDALGVCVSRGSACASGAQTPSPVLLAMGIDEKNATSTLRLSFHPNTSIEDVKKGVEIIAQCVNKLESNQKVASN